MSLITPELLYIGKRKAVHLRKRNMKAIPKGVLKSKLFGVRYHTCDIIRVGSGVNMPKGRPRASVYIYMYTVFLFISFQARVHLKKKGGWVGG